MRPFNFILQWGARQLWMLRHRSRATAHPVPSLPRLLVDVSVILRHDPHTGIQRVVRAVWSELRRLDGHGFELVPVYATYKEGYSYAPIDFLVSRRRSQPGAPVVARPTDKFLGLDLSAQFLPKYRAQIKAWRAQGTTVHVMVYDLLPLMRPEWFNPTTTLNFHRWFKVLANDADHAICISRQVSRDLRDRLRATHSSDHLSITNIPLGGDIGRSHPTEGMSKNVVQLLDRLRFRPSILMVGTIEPRKGYETAIAAFEHLWGMGGGDAPDLVIVGKKGWKTEALQKRIRSHKEHGARLHWLEGVSDEGLCRLYEASRGLLMTSFGEGFGLPLVEAMTQRRQVLARDLPVFREQELPGILYFEDDQPAVLGEKVMELARSGPLPSHIQIQLPEWRACVKCLLDSLGIESNASERAPNAKVAE